MYSVSSMATPPPTSINVHVKFSSLISLCTTECTQTHSVEIDLNAFEAVRGSTGVSYRTFRV